MVDPTARDRKRRRTTGGGLRVLSGRRAPSIMVGLFSIALLSLQSTPAEAALGWSQVDRDGVYIQYHAPNRSVAEGLVDQAVEARREVSEFLLYRPKVQVRVLLASDRDEFRRILGDSVPDWGGGIAFPDQGAIVLFMPNPAEWEKPLPAILRHEIAHIVLHHALDGQPVPRWFDEGFAMYQSREWRPDEGLIIARAVLFRAIIPLEEIRIDFPRHAGQASLAYQESYSAIEYLVDRYDEDGLKGLIYSLISGGDFDRALTDEFGITLPEFESRWLTWLRTRYRWVIILSDPEIVFPLMTFLFILAYVAVKLRNRRKLARWEREERGLPGK